MPQHLTYHKSPLVQVMVWCRQAASHYLSQCWPRSLSPYDVTRPQWVKINRTTICILLFKEHQGSINICFNVCVLNEIKLTFYNVIYSENTLDSQWPYTLFYALIKSLGEPSSEIRDIRWRNHDVSSRRPGLIDIRLDNKPIFCP